MNIKEERKQRLSVTLLFSAIVILIFVAVLLLVSLGLYFLYRLGILSDPQSVGNQAPEVLVIFAVSSIVVGSCMTLLISRYPMRPVNNLINIMNRLASGDFSARIQIPKPWNRHPAIAELSDSFNKMAEELQNTEVLRSDFINNFSHEFKTPIVSIAGFAKLLKREQLTEQQMEYVRIIEEESLRLSQIATNVLNMTKVENQTILTDVTTYNLSEQLRTCILLLRSKWEKKEIEFSLDLQEQDITGSEDLLQHIWLNLIDNAIKFSPKQSLIEISLREYIDFTEVSVMNMGDEIPFEKQQKIFNKFYQTDESHAAQGNGIGLAIVKKIVDLHKGSVCVRSENKATTFTVRLPKINQY